MFINKWLVADSFNKYKEAQAQLCLYLNREPEDMGSLYGFLQGQPVENSFTILLSGEDFNREADTDSYIEKIIGLFFQPSYYLVNYQPLIFLNSKTAACTEFLSRLAEKSMNQGLQNILILEIKNSDNIDNKNNQFAYRVTSRDISYTMLMKNWIIKHLHDKNPTEIHFLVSAKENEAIEIFNSMLEKEKALQETEDYEIANGFYQKQKLIEEYKHELSLKLVNEMNIQLYLNIQKEQAANSLKWYYNEYEILPRWYKQFGHIIKVLMGKRSFRSLFNDDVKKYKD
jgi:hypothetical protein